MISDFSIKKFISDSSNKKNKGFCITGTYFSSGYQDTGTELFIFPQFLTVWVDIIFNTFVWSRWS